MILALTYHHLHKSCSSNIPSPSNPLVTVLPSINLNAIFFKKKKIIFNFRKKFFILAVTILLFDRLVCQTIIHLEFIMEVRRANLKTKRILNYNLTMYFQIFFSKNEIF